MNFNVALSRILDLEGGFSDSPHDPGGKTKYGITEAVAKANGYTGKMQELPLEVASTIYRRDYWDACRCDEIPWPMSLYVFDAAVNQGTTIAIMLLQHAIDCTQDGIVGPNTIRLANVSKPWHASRFLALRAARYADTRGYEHYGIGWFTRLFEIARAG